MKSLLISKQNKNRSATKGAQLVFIGIPTQSSSQEQETTRMAEKFCLTSSFIPDSDCNSTSSACIYFSPIICLQFRQYCLLYCKDARTLKIII